MKKGKNIFNTLKYLPLVALPLLAQEAKGQFFPIPPKVINPFISLDTTAVARAYSAINGLSLEDITARNDMTEARVKSDRTYTITGGPTIDWNCQHWTLLHIVNAYNWGEGVYNVGGTKLLYNGYKGWDLAQIYANGGTLVDQGKMGLPLFRVEFILDPNTREAHTQTALLSGNHALVGNNWNDIEPRDGTTQLQPGQPNTNIPLNTDEFILSYSYVGKTSAHEKVLDAVLILKFKIVNGQMILTYNINDDPIMSQFTHLITERENDPPVINIKNSALDSLVLNINEVNPRSQYVIIDGGTPIPITTNEKRKLNLTPGTHNITVQADDYFNLKSQKTFQRTIAGPNNPPTIKITKPINRQKYSTSPELEYAVTDTDLNTVTYSVNKGPKITINPTGKIPLNLTNGQYTIVIEATDKKPQTAKDSVSFEINTPPAIKIDSPIEGTTYDHNINLQYTITDTDFNSASYSINGQGKIPIPQNGTILLYLDNQSYTIVIEATDNMPQTAKDTVRFVMNKPIGIEDPTPGKITTLYPNPVKDILHIQYNLIISKTAYRTITTLSGQLVVRKIIGNMTEEAIDVTSFKKGMYIMIISYESTRQEFKIIIE